MVKLIEKDFEKFIHPKDREMVRENLKKVNESGFGESVETVFRLKKSKQEYTWVRLIQQVFDRDNSGIALKTVLSLEDISDRMQLQEQLLSHVQKLRKISFVNFHELRDLISVITRLVDFILKMESFSNTDRTLVMHLKRSIEELNHKIHSLNDLCT